MTGAPSERGRGAREHGRTDDLVKAGDVRVVKHAHGQDFPHEPALGVLQVHQRRAANTLDRALGVSDEGAGWEHEHGRSSM